MNETVIRLRERTKILGHPVMSDEELRLYRDADLEFQKRMMGDLQKRSGMFMGRYGGITDYDTALNKIEGSFPKEMQTGRKAKKGGKK